MAAEVPASHFNIAHQLLAVLACGEVFGFHTMADASARSEPIDQKVTLMDMAIEHAQGYHLTRQRLVDSGLDADPLIDSYSAPLASYHTRTTPSDEFQALLKAYVGTGIASDFMREMSLSLDQETRDFVAGVLARPRVDEAVVQRLRSVMASDQSLAGPMALWGRRLMGEALSQAQRVAVDRPEIVALILGAHDLEAFQQMIVRMTTSHSQRMRSLGLYP